jgi:hypothetical protein
MPVAKLRFAAGYPTATSPSSREAELPDPRSQAELGNERENYPKLFALRKKVAAAGGPVAL